MAVVGRSGRSRFTLTLLVLTSVTVLTLDVRGAGVIDGVREGALDLLAPVQSAADTVFGPFGNAWNGVFDYGDLEAKNRELQQRVDELEGEVLRTSDAEAELRQAQELLDLEFVGDIESVAARVVAAPVSNFDLTVEIDRGSREGIREGMPVVGGAGLVGEVVRVSRNRAVVRLMNDPSFAVGVVLTTSGETGLAEGLGASDPLSVTSVSVDVAIERGEVVKTSGAEGSQFPAGLPVGTVRSARVLQGSLEQRVRVDPAVDLDRLNLVKVLLWQRVSS